MRRLSAALVVLIVLLTGSLASDLPAGAAPQGGSRAPRSAGQEVGDTVTVFSTDGDEEGSVTVTDLVDDFEETEDQPPVGERIVSLDVEIEADGGDIAVDPANFNLVDSNGSLWIDIELARTDDAEPLEATGLADGDAVEGSLEIVIPSDVDIDRLLYVVDVDRVLTLLDTTSGVEAGDAVDIVTAEGEETGTVVVDEVFEGFEDVESGSEPGRGETLYGLAVTAEATATEPLAFGPELFIAVDENGTLFRPVALERTPDSLDDIPDLESGEVEEGEEVTGFLAFEVSEDVAVDYVAYVPDARFYPVVDDASASGRDDDSTPAADEDETPTRNDDTDDDSPLGRTDDDEETPATDDDPAPAGDCPGVAAWEDDAVVNVRAWSDVFGAIDADNLDADELRDSAAEVAEIAEAQADSDPPTEAEELNDLLAEAYQDSAAALEDLADAVEEGDDELRIEAATTIQEIGASFQDGEVQDAIVDLRDVCGSDVDDL